MGLDDDYLNSLIPSKIVGFVVMTLGNPLGQRYVLEYLSREIQEEANEVVKFLKDALRVRLEHLDWMEDSTRNNALAKLQLMKAHIGSPEKWEDYSYFQLNRNLPYLSNIRIVLSKTKQKDLNKIKQKLKICAGETADYFRVNAFYNPETNEMVIPAGILQKPFVVPVHQSKIPSMQAAVNFGYFGSVIGHELTHGFDNNGRKFNGHGALSNWWSTNDEKKYLVKAKKIIQEYEGLDVFDDKLSGVLTLDENIADLGGLKLSYIAFQNWMKQYGRPEEVEGYTPEQIFFIAYAQFRSAVPQKEIAYRMLRTDNHAPDIYRVNVPLANMQEFYDAFGTPSPSQGMYRKDGDRAQIW